MSPTAVQTGQLVNKKPRNNWHYIPAENDLLKNTALSSDHLDNYQGEKGQLQLLGLL